MWSALVAAVLVAPPPRPWVAPEPGIVAQQPRKLSKQGRTPAVTPVGAGFVAVWLEHGKEQYEGCVVAQRLSAAGAPEGDLARLACVRGAIGPAVASDGETVAVVWGDGGGVAGVTLGPDLSLRGRLAQSLLRFPSGVGVAWDGEAFVAVWSTAREVAARRFDGSGAVRGAVVPLATTQGDASDAAIACTPDLCSIQFQVFHGNSESEMCSASLRRGVGGAGGCESRAFEAAVAAGGGRLQVFVNNYSVVRSSDGLFSYDAPGVRLDAVSAAVGLAGSMVAWTERNRALVAEAVAVAFVPPGADAVRPSPLRFEAGEPALATRDGRRFLLLSATRGWDVVALRVIDVDPAAFAAAPQSPAAPQLRGPVATGVVVGPGAQPAAGARVHWFLRMAGGGSQTAGAVARTDGAFELPHPKADDLTDDAVVTQLVVWAETDGAVSRPQINSPGPLRLELHAWDRAAAARVQLTARDRHRGARWHDDLSVLLAPGVPDDPGLRLLKAGRILELAGVPPGEHALIYMDAAGFHVGQLVTVAPARLTRVDLPFEVDTPKGRVGAVLDPRGDRARVMLVIPGSPAEQAGVQPGDVLLEVDGKPAAGAARARELLAGPPGSEVRLHLQRPGGLVDLRARRSTGEAPPPAQVSTAPLPAPDPAVQAAAALVRPRPGERLLEVAPPLEQVVGPQEAFDVTVPELVGAADSLRVILDVHHDVLAPGAPVGLTITGPLDLRLTKDLLYYNKVIGGAARVPLSVGGPTLGCEAGELGAEGVYDLEVSYAGARVRRRFRVTGMDLAMGLDRHQQHQIGAYRLAARAALQTYPSRGGLGPSVQRAVFRDGAATLEVDMVEPVGGRPLGDLLEADGWPNVATTPAGPAGHLIKLRRAGDGFEALWPTGGLIVRLRGSRYDKAEQRVVEHYLSFYESRW